KGEITWKQNVILPVKPDLQSDALRISQLHGFDVADVNGDGVLDILTGKRFWAHGPTGDAEPDAPAVVYWFIVKRNPDKSVEFTPLKVDDNSGVGTQVAAADLNGDKVPDVIVGNKKGTFIFLSEPAK
ncbi:MAG TPA: VCBS repeat-containing protein, partial [Planctomycetota bacterium]|nr:VCBS repeat-containing protein [Planctomycetota bacterium]